MCTSIVVPLDGSALSEHALPLASQIASSSHATIHLAQVHIPIINVEIADIRLGGVPTIDTTLDEESRLHERDYLETLQSRLHERFNVPVTVALLDGPIPDAIREYSATIHADLIVMTTHGRGPVSRFWLGSIADGLVRHSHVPVLLERPHAAPAARPTPTEIRHILLPLDGSPLAESIVERAIELGAPLEATYTLLHVVDPLLLVGATPLLYTAVPDPEVERQRELSAQHYLDSVAERMRARGMQVNTRVLLGATPALAIIEEAQRTGVDLIALATHGRSGLVRLVLGSTADKVLRGADVPVLLYRPVERTAVEDRREERIAAVGGV